MNDKIIAQNKQHLRHLIMQEIELNGDNCNLNHIDVSNIEDMGQLFLNTDFNGNLELVQYLLTTKDFKKHANIHAQDDYGFQIACNSEYLDIISFLIFDQKLKKTQNIKKYLKENPNQEVLNMFKIRDLNEKINSELSSNNIINKKVKL